MAGSVSDDFSTEDSSSGKKNCKSNEALAECRLSEQVDNGTPSTSPPYWDIDDDDDGPKPSELFGRHTWKIEKFSQTSKRELKSDVFNVGSYKWYILIYPQGCDVCDHLSLFLCVANHDKFLPGWSHFAQFTIAVVNKDPKKSKYSDTLHRFWKKEHDWGWKKFMELSKVQEGFVVNDTLEIRAQVQIIREKANRPFRCLDRQYRRELVRVYLTNVEQICRRLVEDSRDKFRKLIDNKVKWLSFYTFWLGIDQSTKDCMLREKIDVIMKIMVKSLFVEKEVTSTLVMDSLNSGLNSLEADSEGINDKKKSLLQYISIKDDMFVLADDVLILLERFSREPLPPKDDKGPQNRTKEDSSGHESIKDSTERDERLLTKLGRKTIETFVLAHIYSKKIEVAYQEVVALKRQEELIREEEEAMLAEIEQREKRRLAEKEKRLKKKMNKQKRNNQKGKDRRNDEKDTIKEAIEDSYSVQLVVEAESIPEEKDNSFEAVSDIEERSPSPVTLENGNAITSPSSMDDSSSTCSTDSVPSVVASGLHMRGFSTNSRTQRAPNREKNQGTTERFERNSTPRTNNDSSRDPNMITEKGYASLEKFNADEPHFKASLSSKNHHRQKIKQHFIKKDASVSSSQSSIDRSSKQMKMEAVSSPQNTIRKCTPLVHPKSVPNGHITTSSVSVKEETVAKTVKNMSSIFSGMVELSEKNYPPLSSHPPSSVPRCRPTAPTFSTDQITPMISRAQTAPIVSIAQTAPMDQTAWNAPIVSTAQVSPLVSTAQVSPLVSTAQASSTVSTIQDSPMKTTVQASQTGSPVQASPMKSTVQASLAGSTAQASPTVSTAQMDPIAPMVSTTQIAPTVSSVQSTPTKSTAQMNPPSMPGFLPTTSFGLSQFMESHPPTFSLSLPSSNVIDHGSLASSGFTFGSLTSELLLNNINNKLQLIETSSRGHSGNSNPAQQNSESATRQAQNKMIDDFPHIDIINYLFDEDSTVSSGPASSSNFQNYPDHEFIFPMVEVGPTINGHFHPPMAYFDDVAHPVYGVYADLALPVPVDFSMYGSNGMWPVGYGGYPFPVPEYPNLACGVSSYAPLYQPSNGH